MSGWVSVNDKFPGMGEQVLVWFGGYAEPYMDIWTFDNTNQYFTSDTRLRKRLNTNLKHCVTDWQPAPGPPK